MEQIIVIVLLTLISAVISKPLDVQNDDPETKAVLRHSLSKRFVNPMFALGGSADSGVSKMRTKRQAEECEKLTLCKLHARSQHSLFAAFQQYFVNKENARLWDHHSRSIKDCEQRYGDCEYEE